MFNKLSAKLRRRIPFIFLIFSLSLVLPTLVLADESTIDPHLTEPISAAPASQNESQHQVFILLRNNDKVQLAQIQAVIEANGGQTLHIFPYQALIAAVSNETMAQLIPLAGVAGVYTQAVDLTTLADYGPAAATFAAAWNSMITAAPAMNMLAATQPDNHNDAFLAPDTPAAGGPTLAAANSATPGYYQTSEFMAGSVAVGIVLLESNGSVDPSTENWTSAEKQLVFNEIMAGLNWWASLEPRANLSFVYDDHFSEPLSTRVEPIARPSYHQQYWIKDAMNGLGYNSSSYFSSVRDYDNALRNTYQTDWAFTIFVVDSSADNDNRFSDGYFAYAYLGGPFMVMTYENDGYGPTNMDAITAHEMGHIFFALDQYAGAYQGCTAHSGYLNIENQNSQYGNCSTNINSIMRGQIYPYTAKAIDPFAAGQIGWRDSDGDNIFDPLDVELPISITNLVLTNNRLTVNGSANITPYPAPTRPDITINTLTSVRYRFDGASWQQATASDGAFNGTSENYHFTSTPLLPGLYILEVAAFDSVGQASSLAATQTVFIPDPAEPGPDTELYIPNGLKNSPTTNMSGVAYHTQAGQLAKVEYRVNGGLWQSATPQDGAFDSNYEPFILPIDLSAPGTYSIEAFATDTAGGVEVNFARREISVGSTQTSVIFLPLVMGGM